MARTFSAWLGVLSRPWLVLLAVGVPLLGCLEFDEPLCPPQRSRTDVRLFGVWRSNAWEVRIRPGRKASEPLQFELWELGAGGRVHDKPGRTVGHVCVGRGGAYLNVRTTAQLHDPKKDRTRRQVYQVFRYAFTAKDQIALQAPEAEVAAAAIEGKLLSGLTLPGGTGRNARVTASGAAALRWIDEAAGAFDREALQFRRVPERP